VRVKRTILLVYHTYSTFVEADHQILSKHYDVRHYHFEISKRLLPFLWAFVRQFAYLIWNAARIDIFYCWFSDYHSLFPLLFAKILSKKSVIIVGGYDSVSIPEIEYGIFYRNNARALFALLTYKLADHIVAVDDSLVAGVNTYLNGTPRSVGLTRYVNNVKHKCTTIPTGYDQNKWHMPTNGIKELSVLSVAVVSTVNELRRKGFDFLLTVATLIPEVKFTLVGAQGQAQVYCEKQRPSNVEVLSAVPTDELVNYFARTKVFCQFSLYEGLPNTLCEAMLCECIPVGSGISGIIKGIGDSGFILNNRDVRQAKNLILGALQSDEALGKKARQRIVDNFLTEHRERALLSLLEDELDKDAHD